MKTLFIVRHAKSSWTYKGIEDIDRPLKKRGIKDAHLMSKFLCKKIEKPDVFVTSSANRALHTAIIFVKNLVSHTQIFKLKGNYIVLVMVI
jgi:phosphohistidine phosphatase